MFCPNCGKQLPISSTFCSVCGKKLPVNGNASQNPNMAINKGLKNAVNGAVYSIEGVRGRSIDVYENKCVIRTKVTVGSLLTNNATDGEKTIYYSDCVGVQFKISGFTIGYLQFETSAGMMNNRNSNFFGENSFTFDPKKISNEKMKEVVAYIKRRIDEIKNQSLQSTTIVQKDSPADELKKMKELLDMGIISQEEFDAKKKQLLNL